ncbi:BLUF domain-containing protein [Maritimibacter sp. UBA3975]|uniref:BLUF domain-containing protein n=1 Tax=Maritimibacter sp. UBA3975 TaxID=1946833 RepID=UPI0025C0C219|nr:BLUF domain-containing protein [Maritimibacter sp. UBA3975]
MVYISLALHPMGHPSDQEILQQSDARCRALGMTGFLFRTGRYFVQVLEGTARDVWTVMTAIRRDPRHDILREWPPVLAPQRTFDGWSMGYGPLDRDGVLFMLSKNCPFDTPRDALVDQLLRISASQN